MVSDTFRSLADPKRWMLTTWFKLLVRYRRLSIGPIWMLLTPILFIGFLGALFVGLSDFSTSVFIPHMAIGFIIWTLLGGYVSRAPTLFERNQAYLQQGGIPQSEIILIDTAELVIHFLHQALLIVVVCLYYDLLDGLYWLMVFPGFLLILLNGYLFSIIFGILGVRYQDLREVLVTISGIAFLATPIIWIPRDIEGAEVAAKVPFIEVYLDYNPFHHFMEIMRAPLMGTEISDLTWTVVAAITFAQLLAASVLYNRYRHMVPIWL